MSKNTTISSTMEYKLENIELSKISNELYDFRDPNLERLDRKSEEFNNLKQSVTRQGILSPIHLTHSTPDGKEDRYVLVDGRRRFLAAKELGFKTIPSIIITGKNPQQLAIITLTQNIHRKDLRSGEKTKAIIKLFNMHGYSIPDIITTANKLGYTSPQVKHRKPIEDKFVEIYESIGLDAGTIYMMVSVIRDLPEHIYDLADKEGLDLAHKALLSHKSLKQHPDIQESLVFHLKDLPNIKQARTYINNYIKKIESGAWKEDEDTGKKSWDSEATEEAISETEEQTRPETVPSSTRQYLSLITATDQFLKEFTNDAKGRKVKDYRDEHIKYSEYYRKEIIDKIGMEECVALRYDLIMVQKVVKSTLDLIERKYPDSFNPNTRLSF